MENNTFAKFSMYLWSIFDSWWREVLEVIWPSQLFGSCLTGQQNHMEVTQPTKYSHSNYSLSDWELTFSKTSITN